VETGSGAPSNAYGIREALCFSVGFAATIVTLTEVRMFPRLGEQVGVEPGDYPNLWRRCPADDTSSARREPEHGP
jgi:hypothetical protein